MINEIQINPPVATYQTPNVLNDLRPINFIFGANGTGKTTISRVIAGEAGHDHCQLLWQGGSELERMVYNRDFVDRNFNQDGRLQGVFTLGEDQVEAEKKIEELRPNIEKVSREIASLNNQLDGSGELRGVRQELSDLDSALREKCWLQKQRHDDYFQVAFIGVRNNADKFKARVLSEYEANTAELLSLDELKRKAQTIFSNDIERVAPLQAIAADELVAFESNALLQKAIIGNQDVEIAELIKRLGNSDWVKQGRKYHEQVPDTCPFCQQSTDEQFEEQLNAFFSEAYDNDVQSLKDLRARYQQSGEHLLTVLEGCLESRNSFLNSELFEADVQALSGRLKSNLTVIDKKITEPSGKVELDSIGPLVAKLQTMVAEANKSTHDHNQTVDNIASEKRTLTAQVWRYVLNELSGDLEQYHQSKERLQQTIGGMEQRLREKNELLTGLQNQVNELEKQTTSIQPTITAINDLLKKFGFTSFSIGEVEDGRHYRIIRPNGEDASRSLSEGEKTFITFLYFYYLIKGAQSPSGITTNRVVVFDDPISSLDSDVLFIVSTLIKEVMELARSGESQIKQVFVLTHNVYFHKEISFHQKRSGRDVLSSESFWMVKKSEDGSIVQRCNQNPVSSAYELLWADLKRQDISNVSLQNTMRRIIETYFTMWGGMGKDKICEKFEGRDKQLCHSLFSWVNDGSHSIHDDIYVSHGEQTNEAYLRVFHEIFVKAGQKGHFSMMMGENAVEVEHS
ncbi:AAA family ATPase [Alteromonas sp. ASW11-36]|uniref:AAA family ATPase n=1 Tax=Alteromonas arenosi TaxID=3055817 RepID=A0ABT7T0G5_9ALTE|nr:AAA family ATPase [Alteromonas sp. ASW11-36]MDM7861920.1 AAA family ATPase [Alteromonas sp. ASW11-36]